MRGLNLTKINPIDIEKASPLIIDTIAFGVRYEPQWRIMDYMGSLIDEILRTPGTPFGPERFTHSRREADEQILINNETEERLRFNATDTILEIRIDSYDLKDILAIAVEFENRVLDILREKVRLRKILRYGMLFKFKECSSELSSKPIEHFIDNDFKNTNTLDLRFSRRLAQDEAMVKSGVNDYRNLIYRFVQNDNSKVFITFDYQEYFDPMLDRDEWEKRKFSEFVNRGLEYYDGQFSSWLKKFVKEGIAA